jgi:hypothetical protein
MNNSPMAARNVNARSLYISTLWSVIIVQEYHVNTDFYILIDERSKSSVKDKNKEWRTKRDIVLHKWYDLAPMGSVICMKYVFLQSKYSWFKPEVYCIHISAQRGPLYTWEGYKIRMHTHVNICKMLKIC